MSFRKSSKAAYSEINARRGMKDKLLNFGITFLDEAMAGIFQDDLILFGAQSGAGKTQMCCLIAQANIPAGKKVHYIALEASEHEIERRMKFPIVTNLYYSDPQRKTLSHQLTFRNWVLGLLLSEMEEYENKAAELFERQNKNIFLYYKKGNYGTDDFIKQVMSIAHDTDLIIVDHAHYFDYNDDIENVALKKIAQTARMLALELQKPIILVGHFRKKDRFNDELIPGMEEFHGSSDLYKIATKVITMAPGKPDENGRGFETFFRVPKNRIDGGVTRFSARCVFNPKKGSYENEYEIGYANQSRANGFEALDCDLYPDWATGSKRSRGASGNSANDAKRESTILEVARRSRSLPNFAPYSDRD